MTSKKQEELCSECDANAEWYCVQDGANFCDQHNTVAHSLKSLKSHKIVSIGEKDVILRNEAAKPMNCKNHHMPLCLYCLSCKVMRDTWNTKLYDPLFDSYESSQKTAKPDKWFHKDRISGLWAHESPLLSYLHDKKLITLFFAGVNTDQCVLGTFEDAFSKGFDCILLRDGCGTTSPSFAREYTEHKCAGGVGFVMETEEFAKGVETSLE